MNDLALNGSGGGEIRKLQMDVNDAQSVERTVNKVLQDEGRIDILVNNA